MAKAGYIFNGICLSVAFDGLGIMSNISTSNNK